MKRAASPSVHSLPEAAPRLKAVREDSWGLPEPVWAVMDYGVGRCRARLGSEEDAMRFIRAVELAEENARLRAVLGGLDLTCTTDVLNPCWDGRLTDALGLHWSGGDACAACTARAALGEVLS